jgi:hypothetical protein
MLRLLLLGHVSYCRYVKITLIILLLCQNTPSRTVVISTDVSGLRLSSEFEGKGAAVAARVEVDLDAFTQAINLKIRGRRRRQVLTESLVRDLALELAPWAFGPTASRPRPSTPKPCARSTARRRREPAPVGGHQSERPQRHRRRLRQPCRAPREPLRRDDPGRVIFVTGGGYLSA